MCSLAFGVGRLPGRRRVALYRTCEQTTRPIAYFDNETDALEFMQFVDAMTSYQRMAQPLTEFHGWAAIE